MAAVTICSGFEVQENKVCHCFYEYLHVKIIKLYTLNMYNYGLLIITQQTSFTGNSVNGLQGGLVKSNIPSYHGAAFCRKHFW